MNKSIASLLAAALLAVPALAQDAQPNTPELPEPRVIEPVVPGAPLGEEAETDIEIIDGIPVDPELKARIMESKDARTVQELIELSDQVLNRQKEQLAEQQKQEDTGWMQGDPLGHLEGEMADLVGDIDQSKTGNDTQTQGKDVVRKMDTLIAMLEKSASACSSCSGGSGSKPGNMANGGKPAPDSTLAAGPGGSGDLSDKGAGNNRFGDLDPAQREAILRAQNESQGFPAEYDALLAEYYARLASEKALDTPEDTTGNE